jgi:hypothetical protein
MPVLPFLNAYAAQLSSGLHGLFELSRSRSHRSHMYRRFIVVLPGASLVVRAYLGRVHQAAPERAVARSRHTLSAITAHSYPESTAVHILGPCYSAPGLEFLHTGLGLSVLTGLRVHRRVSATQGFPKRRVLQLQKSFEGIRQRLLGNCMAIFSSFLIGCLL